MFLAVLRARYRAAVAGLSAFVSLAGVGGVPADTPGFDRPGIAFSPSIIPSGGFALELGLPDFLHTSDAGISSTLYSLDSNVRAGLGHKVELQLATPLFSYQAMSAPGASGAATGRGDTSLALKTALPSASDQFTWAALAGITFATGQDAFTARTAQYRLATTMSLKLNNTYSTGFYINANYYRSRVGYRLSSNLDFAMSDSLSGYVEVAYDHVPQSPDATIAGGGMAWMVARTVQLDLSVDLGVSRHAPDAQGGLGVSFYFQ